MVENDIPLAKEKRHITGANARELQKRSWDARRANKAMRDYLLPLGLWDTSNGRPHVRRMQQLLDQKDRLSPGYVAALVWQHWPQIELIIDDALRSGNAKQGLWALETMVSWIRM